MSLSKLPHSRPACVSCDHCTRRQEESTWVIAALIVSVALQAALACLGMSAGPIILSCSEAHYSQDGHRAWFPIAIAALNPILCSAGFANLDCEEGEGTHLHPPSQSHGDSFMCSWMPVCKACAWSQPSVGPQLAQSRDTHGTVHRQGPWQGNAGLGILCRLKMKLLIETGNKNNATIIS